MTASPQHYWEMGSGEWVPVAYLAYMGEPPLQLFRSLQLFKVPLHFARILVIQIY